MDVQFKQQLTKEEYASFLSANRKKGITREPVVIGLVCLGYLILSFFKGKEIVNQITSIQGRSFQGSVLSLVVFSILLLIFFFLGIVFLAQAGQQKNIRKTTELPGLQKTYLPREYTITSDYIHTHTEFEEQKVRWAALFEIKETDEFITLYTNEIFCFILLKRAMDDEQLETLRQLIKEHYPNEIIRLS